MRLSNSIVASMVLGTAVCVPALGGVANPPPWQGSGLVGNEVMVRWDFTSISNPVGMSETNVGSGPAQMGGPVNFDGSGFLTIPAGGTIVMDVPNFPHPNDFKLVWVQYHIVGGPVFAVDPVIGGSAVNSAGITVFATPWGVPILVPPQGGIGAQGLYFPFNPDHETITLFNPGTTPMVLDWLQINTICAPSPCAAAILGLGGLLVARRRR
ncbi:MAG: hypothetical protein ACREJO_11795 [Phycisphaerales bacterium]